MPPPTTAARLFRDVGLLPDGPAPWGRPVAARGPGVFVVELPGPLAAAPIELTRVGKWIERVPELRLDGARPTSRALSARIASFWLPDQVVLYVGTAASSLGRRIAAMEATPLGDRRPHAGGHWLRTLDLPAGTSVWWASTEAVEEYEDALLAAFADGVDAGDGGGGGTRLILPFANLRLPTGERRATGLTGSLLPEPVAPAAPRTRVVLVPDGDAEGARGEPPEPRRPRSPRQPRSTSATLAVADAAGAAGAPGPEQPVRPSTSAPAATLTATGAARMQAELDELVRERRPEVIARIRAAKELGDLKENADYTAAREEQSFLEGRIQALESRLRNAVVADRPAAGPHADLGSIVTVETDGLTAEYTLVGSAEADLAAGRLSVASPVGRALLGKTVGDEVVVQTPRGPVGYRVTALA
jgi:transcription elongation factor GreA